MKPSEIYYSQDSINNVFGDHCMHRGRLIGLTLDLLCEGHITVDDIPCIGVMQKGGRWYTGDNRRLWIFRHLERLGKCWEIPVKRSYIPDKKFTTCNRGESVKVRGHPGGQWYQKNTPTRPPLFSTISNTAYNRSESSISHFYQSRQSSSSLRNTLSTRSPSPVDVPFYLQNEARSSSSSITPAYDRWALDSRQSTTSKSNLYQGLGLTNRQTCISPVQTENFKPTERALLNLTLSEPSNIKYVDPLDCRFLKDSISRHFDNGQPYNNLAFNLTFGHLSYRNIPAIKVYEAYGSYYVHDGNRRLKAIQEARNKVPGIKIKVEVIGDEDDLLDELRSEDPAVTAFEVMQLGETVNVH